jgi:hypothetical protein
MRKRPAELRVIRAKAFMRGPHDRKNIPSHTIDHRSHCDSFPVVVGFPGPGILREIANPPASTIIGGIIVRTTIAICICPLFEMETSTYTNPRYTSRLKMEFILSSL